MEATATPTYTFSTVTKKVAMAISGLVLVGFVVGHMLGNLKVFGGVEPSGVYMIDQYAASLRQIGSEFLGYKTFLWIVRAVLLAAVVIHAIAGIQLSLLNRRARPVAYKMQKFSSANAASRTMFYGGILLLIFVVYHLLDLSGGILHNGTFVDGAVYSNLYSDFSNKGVAAFYVIAMAALSLHLYHGTWSMFQTLGVDHPSWNGGIRTVAKLLAVVIFFGFAAVPLSFALGLMPPPA